VASGLFELAGATLLAGAAAAVLAAGPAFAVGAEDDALFSAYPTPLSYVYVL
jgi:hypothetical protein